LPEKIQAFGTCSVDETVFIVGGFGDKGCSKNIWKI